MRSIGTSTSSAVVGVVLAHMTTRLGPVALPSLTGFRVTLLIGGGAAVVAFLIAALNPSRRRSAPEVEVSRRLVADPDPVG
jgi:hypothetical protein